MTTRPDPAEEINKAPDTKEGKTAALRAEAAPARDEHHHSETATRNGSTDQGRKHWLEYVTAGFACVAALGSISAVIVGYWQWGIMDRQANILEIGQRPWVTADFDPISVTKSDNGIDLAMNITFKNIGHAPARNIFPFPRLVPDDPPRLGYLEKNECAEDIKVYWNVKDTRSGIFFPGDTVHQKMTPGVTTKEIRDFQADMLARNPGKPQITQDFINNDVAVAVIGCINFQFDGSPDVHQTGFVLELSRKYNEVIYVPTQFDMRAPNGELQVPDMKLIPMLDIEPAS